MLHGQREFAPFLGGGLTLRLARETTNVSVVGHPEISLAAAAEIAQPLHIRMGDDQGISLMDAIDAAQLTAMLTVVRD